MKYIKVKYLGESNKNRKTHLTTNHIATETEVRFCELRITLILAHYHSIHWTFALEQCHENHTSNHIIRIMHVCFREMLCHQNHGSRAYYPGSPATTMQVTQEA